MASNGLTSLASFSFPTQMIHLRLIDLSFNRLAQLDAMTFTNLGPNLEVCSYYNSVFFQNFSALHVVGVRIELHFLNRVILENLRIFESSLVAVKTSSISYTVGQKI